MSTEEYEPYSGLKQSSKIIILGGGCYGSLFSLRISRAKQRRLLDYAYQLIVDLDSNCKAISENKAEELVFFNGDWMDFIVSYYRYFVNENDYIILPCNTPHFLFRLYFSMLTMSHIGDMRVYELPEKLGYPYEVFSNDTIFVSYSKGRCPFLCIEPRICPLTRDKRDWNVKAKLYDYLAQKDDLEISDTYIFESDLYVNGIALISAKKIIDNYNRFVSQLSCDEKLYMLATLSECHGAISFFSAKGKQII